jgi:predicted small lipoprotein YifL
MRKILLLMGIAFLLAACGKKGPLVPPEALAPSPINNLRVSQTGTGFSICLTPPSTDEIKKPLKNLAGFRVLKREVLPPDEDCEECPTAYHPFQIVDMEFPKDVQRFGSLYCLADTDLVAGKTYQYKAVSFQADGTTSKDSNKVRRKFVQPPSAPVLKSAPATTGVVLEWVSPSHPGQGVAAGFNIYRGESAERMPPDPINDKPFMGNRYEDQNVTLGTKYFYVVRSVIKIDGDTVESEASNSVSGEMKLPEE